MQFGDCREGWCVVLCMLVCFEAEVGSWFGIVDMGYIAGVVAVHTAQPEVLDLAGRKVWFEGAVAGCRMV